MSNLFKDVQFLWMEEMLLAKIIATLLRLCAQVLRVGIREYRNMHSLESLQAAR